MPVKTYLIARCLPFLHVFFSLFSHSLELPAHPTHLTDCAFITRMLYKDVY